jgi:putative MATE family efflux protein
MYTTPMNSDSQIDISYRRIFRIAGPVMLTQLTYAAMGFIDTVMVGQLGVTALAAIGLGAMVVWWLNSFLIGAVSGVNTAVSQAEGASDRRGVGDSFVQGTWMGIFIGLGLGLILAWQAFPTFLRWVDPEPEVRQIAHSYMQIRMLSVISLVPLLVADSVYRGLGRTVVPMISAALQLLLNCGLNYVLIFGKLGFPEMGAPGTALGTVLSQFIVGSVLWLSIPLGRIGGHYSVLSRLRPNPVVLKMLFGLSLPIGLQSFMEMGGVSVFGVVMARLGEAEMAATQAVIQNWSVAFMAGFGLSVTATTLVGQCVGSGDLERARLAVKRVLLIGYLLMLPMAVLYLFLPEQLMSIFAHGADLELLRPFARPLFLIVTVCLILDLRFMVFSGSLRGAGDTSFPMWVNIASAWLVFVPAVVLVTPRWGIQAGWWCFVVHLLVMSTLLAYRFSGQGWRGKTIADRMARSEGPLVTPSLPSGLGNEAADLGER